MRKYAPKESKLMDKQSRLDEQSNKLYTKYKLAGKDAEYARRQAKLDEKRNKLLEKERKLASNYKLESERKLKPCRGNNCATCPVGTVAGRHGCVASPPGTPQCGSGYHSNGSRCVQDNVCAGGYQWNGYQCVQEAANSFGNSNCTAYYVRLMEQKRILDDLKRSQAAACAGNSASAECISYTQQVSMAENIYRQLEAEYSRCQLHP